ncbi:MAG: hypothetical protein A2073_05665 [Deltaproteobacteria bacterium GWC2_42_11]|nr:MAG: hypothetical protein A2073_05665 [Deltaproteobacteria bacterium GWC2_42_11]HBO84326.1 hypothetical protein [Deltaproteobacteria bacterium]
MKKEIIFISVMTVLGVALGLGIIIILASVGMPNYSEMLLSLQEKTDFEMMSKSLIFSPGSGKMTITSVVFLILATTASVLFASNMNQNILNALRHKNTIFKALVVFLGCLGYLILPLLFLNKIFFLQSTSPDSIILLLSVFITGILWFFAGETGWAGDFSSWRIGNNAKPAKTFLMGGMTGIIAYLLSFINGWAFNKYFILVSEVLDKTGETSYLGFKLLAYGLMFMSGISLCILAGVIVALSPTYKETRQRITGIIFPSILFIIFISVVAGVYQNASKKYDINKKNLAEAVGIPEKVSSSRTVVLFASDKTAPQQLPMQTMGSSFVGTYTIELSYENLKKIEDYLDKHKEGSVFMYAGRDALINGYHTLWDIKKGIEWQFKSSNDMLLPRMMMLARLKNLPVTPENLSYLKSFSDKSRWHIGGKHGLRMAEGFMHFNLIEEAKALVKESKEKGADVSKATFLDEPVFTDGKISGTLKINGKEAPNIKIALLAYTDSVHKFENVSLTGLLLDVRESDPAGKFSFEYLGKGDFMIAVMTDKETIPYNILPEKFRVENSPGKIKLDTATKNLDLGNINITFRQ